MSQKKRRDTMVENFSRGSPTIDPDERTKKAKTTIN